MNQPQDDEARKLKIDVARSTEISLELDDEKIQAIRSCLEKGTLTIRIADVDLSRGGRLQAAYIYD